jgi:hypothetical protein
MTNWTPQIADEIVTDLQKEVDRILALPMGLNYDKRIFIGQNLYEKLKDDWTASRTQEPPNLEKIVWDKFVVEAKKIHDEKLTEIIFHPEVFKYLTRKSHKKIKRRLFYEVIWWTKCSRNVKCFQSAAKMRKFVNLLHLWYDDAIEIEKTWCYREHTPKHKWYYVSYRLDSFVCLERY